MKNLLAVLLMFCVSLSFGCSVVGGIFKAGVWVGVLIVLGIIGLIIYFVTRAKK